MVRALHDGSRYSLLVLEGDEAGDELPPLSPAVEAGFSLEPLAAPSPLFEAPSAEAFIGPLFFA